MSFEGHPFRWVPSLEHMAKVKIFETLWRNVTAGEKITKFLIENSSCQNIHYSWVRNAMNEKIHTMLDGLQISEGPKFNFEWPVGEMVYGALEWLDATYKDNPSLKSRDKDWADASSYFVDNLCFDNFGCVDGRKTLRSYVSGKERVGFWVWHQLCLYCIEDKIVEFSKKFNWQECSGCLNSQLAVYWYRRIHGELPSDEMLTYYNALEGNIMRLVGAFSNEANIEQSTLEVLTRLIPERNSRLVPAIIHFQNQLNNDEEFNLLVSNSFYPPGKFRDPFIPLLRTRTNEASLEPLSRNADDMLEALMKWPWITFINDWKHMYKSDINPAFFTSFFNHVGSSIDRMKGHNKAVLCKVLEEIAEIFHQKFSSDLNLIARAFWAVLFRQNGVHICTVMLKDVESHQKKLIIEEMRNNFQIIIEDPEDSSNYYLYFPTIDYDLMISSHDFGDIANRVFSGEEREFFWKTYDQYYLKTVATHAKTYSSSDCYSEIDD